MGINISVHGLVERVIIEISSNEFTGFLRVLQSSSMPRLLTGAFMEDSEDGLMLDL